MIRDFWRNASVAVIGGGSWGTVLAQLVAKNCASVKLWVRDEAQARAINSTRTNAKYLAGIMLSERIQAHSELVRVFSEPVQLIIWALPSKACREISKEMAPKMTGEELLLHATKGIEEGTLKRVSVILREELPCPRIGVISGPNLAREIALGHPAATVVASNFREVVQAGTELLMSEQFRVYESSDVVGVEWAGALKNILALAAGSLEAMGLGANVRAMLIARGLAEMVRFGTAMGAQQMTFLGLAGVGDLLATCSSSLSRNFQVGYRLAKGEKLEAILANLGTTAEGVRTAQSVWTYAEARGIEMPITQGVFRLLRNELTVNQILDTLMRSPRVEDVFN